MVSIDQKLGIAIFSPEFGHNPGRFFHFIETSIEMLTYEGISRFIVDFSRFPSLSTRELMILVRLAGSLPSDSIILTGIPEYITKLLSISGLNKIFRIFNDIPSAIQFVTSSSTIDKAESSNISKEEQKVILKPASA